MNPKIIPCLIFSLFFGVLGVWLHSLLRDDRKPREGTAFGTITQINTTDGGNARVHMQVTIGGRLYPDCVATCQKWPRDADTGTQVTVCYRMLKNGVPDCRILSEGFEALSVSYAIPVLLLVISAALAGLAVFFGIKGQ